MPIIKSAIKKVRKDKLRTARNKKRELSVKSLLKKARISKSPKDLQAVFSALDKAAKVKLIHPNKSARLKSRLSKLVSHPSDSKATIKKTSRKTK
ncbi:MAG: 30S ribosomal protein S20 [Candidatus Daviesbacteria bacterium]|nr:30S ribosomal protein S20 [Candidatus Daviesbacteria bacterium]